MTAIQSADNSRQAALTILLIVVLSFVCATFARNAIWRDDAALMSDVAEKSPQNPRAFAYLGAYFNQHGDPDKAISYLTTALRLNSGSGLLPGIYVELGNAYAFKGDTLQAIAHYESAIDLDPAYADAYINLGSQYGSSGQMGEAIDSFLKALRLDPTSAKAYNNLGNVYFHGGMTDKATDAYQMAIQAEPGFAEAYRNLALAYSSGGFLERSIELFDIAIRLKPEFAPWYVNRGDAYLKAGNRFQAIADYKSGCTLGSSEGCNKHRKLSAGRTSSNNAPH